MKGTHQQPCRSFAHTQCLRQVHNSESGVFGEQDQSLTVPTEEAPRFFCGWHVRILYIQMNQGK